jgi:hypothetical protein
LFIIHNPTISAGTYDITVGIDSATTADRIINIQKQVLNQLRALGGGDGAYWNYELSAAKSFIPLKAYNAATTRSASTIMSAVCQKHTMTFNTARNYIWKWNL